METRRDQAAFELIAQPGDDAEEHVMGDASRIASEKFGLIALVFTDEGLELFSLGAEEAFLDAFEFDLAEVFDLDSEFLLPPDQGAFGDVEFLGDAIKTPAFGAEFDEFVFSFWRMHISSLGFRV